MTLTYSQGHISRSKVTDVEVSAFSECFLFSILTLRFASKILTDLTLLNYHLHKKKLIFYIKNLIKNMTTFLMYQHKSWHKKTNKDLSARNKHDAQNWVCKWRRKGGYWKMRCNNHVHAMLLSSSFFYTDLQSYALFWDIHLLDVFHFISVVF